jgi:hypothetical protein
VKKTIYVEAGLKKSEGPNSVVFSASNGLKVFFSLLQLYVHYSAASNGLINKADHKVIGKQLSVVSKFQTSSFCGLESFLKYFATNLMF